MNNSITTYFAVCVLVCASAGYAPFARSAAAPAQDPFNTLKEKIVAAENKFLTEFCEKCGVFLTKKQNEYHIRHIKPQCQELTKRYLSIIKNLEPKEYQETPYVLVAAQESLTEHKRTLSAHAEKLEIIERTIQARRERKKTFDNLDLKIRQEEAKYVKEYDGECSLFFKQEGHEHESVFVKLLIIKTKAILKNLTKCYLPILQACITGTESEIQDQSEYTRLYEQFIIEQKKFAAAHNGALAEAEYKLTCVEEKQQSTEQALAKTQEREQTLDGQLAAVQAMFAKICVTYNITEEDIKAIINPPKIVYPMHVVPEEALQSMSVDDDDMEVVELYNQLFEADSNK